MGRDKSLTDDFPSVDIDGRRYHYGRETVYGQYLVESAMNAKDYWAFETKEDLEAFLILLPGSAARDWATQQHPTWHEVSDEQRSLWIEERRKDMRTAAANRKKTHPGLYFNVLQFDTADWYMVPYDWRSKTDSVVVHCTSRSKDDDQREWLVTLCKGDEYVTDERVALTLSREQAISLAHALLGAAGDVRRHQENE